MLPTPESIALSHLRTLILVSMAELSTIDLSAASREHAQNVIRETAIKHGRARDCADWIILEASGRIVSALAW